MARLQYKILNYIFGQISDDQFMKIKSTIIPYNLKHLLKQKK